MKSTATRKNQFKKNKGVRCTPFGDRAFFTAKAVLGALALVATSGAFIFTYDYFTQAGHFQARQIVVTGQQTLSRRHILEIADIGKQTNILAVNLTTTRKRLLADPWIADVTVSRKIPSGLGIQIREETPLALLEMGAGQGFLINVAGEVFKRVDGVENTLFPRVRGLGLADLPVPGQPVTKAYQGVMTLLRLAGKKNSPFPLADIRRVHMDREIGATIYIGEDNRAVKLGFGHYRKKCAALGHLLVRLSRESRLTRYRAIDLFDLNRIVISPALASQSGSDHGEV